MEQNLTKRAIESLPVAVDEIVIHVVHKQDGSAEWAFRSVRSGATVGGEQISVPLDPIASSRIMTEGASRLLSMVIAAAQEHADQKPVVLAAGGPT